MQQQIRDMKSALQTLALSNAGPLKIVFHSYLTGFVNHGQSDQICRNFATLV